MKAHEILEAGLGHMKDRSATYDKPAGERSMGATVDAFRAITGHDLTEEQGWLFMGLLKMVRSQQGGFRADNYEDLAAYAGLQGEAAWAERANQDFGQQNTLDYRTDEQKGFNDPRTVVGVDVSFPTEKHMNFAPECEHNFEDHGSYRFGSRGQQLTILNCGKCGAEQVEAEDE
jgi:hypothetical protein